MPIGEIETHPYLEQGKINGATKLILGSFPVYECTDEDNFIKQKNRQREGTIRFFYGSKDSSFWQLYHDFVDDNITLPPNPNNIILSLTQREIAISDTIASCQRHEYRSEDNKLIRRTYNKHMIKELINKGVKKIICTSKGVLVDLENQIILHGEIPFGNVDNISGKVFQNNFISKLGGNCNQIINPIAKVFNIGDFQVTAIAIPSPGSPQRQLARFGFNGNDWGNYSKTYFLNAFNWLNE